MDRWCRAKLNDYLYIFHEVVTMPLRALFFPLLGSCGLLERVRYTADRKFWNSRYSGVTESPFRLAMRVVLDELDLFGKWIHFKRATRTLALMRLHHVVYEVRWFETHALQLRIALFFLFFSRDAFIILLAIYYGRTLSGQMSDIER